MPCTRLLLGAGALALMALYFTFDPAEASFFPRCPLVAATGLQCAGCGSQRAIHALLHGEFAAAWAFNPLLLLALPYVFLGYVAQYRARFSPLWARFRKTAYGTPAIYVVGAVVVTFTIGRNLN